MSENGQLVFGSIWEQNVYIALVQQKKRFEYQVPFFGGRRVRGGTIVDFIVYAPDPIALYVDGPQWHRKKKAIDQIIRTRLERMGYRIMVAAEESETLEGASAWVKENIPV